MATIEFIQNRIAGKEKEIIALEKKLARIQKAEAGGWESNNPYMYSESDLRGCLQDLSAAQAALEKYKANLELSSSSWSSGNKALINSMRISSQSIKRNLPSFARRTRSTQTSTTTAVETILTGRSTRKRTTRLGQLSTPGGRFFPLTFRWF